MKIKRYIFWDRFKFMVRYVLHEHTVEIVQYFD
jgi:hypothetical protein